MVLIRTAYAKRIFPLTFRHCYFLSRDLEHIFHIYMSMLILERYISVMWLREADVAGIVFILQAVKYIRL